MMRFLKPCVISPLALAWPMPECMTVTNVPMAMMLYSSTRGKR